VQPPPAACTLDADAQAKAGLYAGMRVELYDLSEDTGRDFDCKLLLPLRIFPQASKGAFSKERSKQSSLPCRRSPRVLDERCHAARERRASGGALLAAERQRDQLALTELTKTTSVDCNLSSGPVPSCPLLAAQLHPPQSAAPPQHR